RHQSVLDLLHRLVALHRAKRIDERLLADELPELFRTAPCQRMLDMYRAAQPDDFFGGVAALDALPARIFCPVLLESCGFQIVVHRCPVVCVMAKPGSRPRGATWNLV